MSGMPDLDEIHVLQETLSRVSQLTSAITHQVDSLQDFSLQARKAVTPQKLKQDNVGQFKDNLTVLLKQISEVEDISRRLNAVSAIIEDEIDKVGLEEYIMSVLKAYRISKELATKPQFAPFRKLGVSAHEVYESGVSSLIQLLRKYIGAVFVPTDLSANSVPKIPVEDLDALKQLVKTVDQFKGTDESVNQQITHVLERFYSGSMDPLKQQVLNKAGVNIQKYTEISVKLVLEICLALDILFGSNSSRKRQLVEYTNMSQQRDVKELQSATSSAPQGLQAPVPRSQPPKPAQTPKPSVPVLHIQPPSSIPHSQSAQTLSSANSHERDSPHEVHTPVQAQPTVHAAHAVSTVLDSPSVASFPASETSKNTNSNTNANSIKSPKSQKPAAWAVFELLDQDMQEPLPEMQLQAAKQECMRLLTQQFQTITSNCRKGVITSEFGVSGASLQLMKVIKSVATYSKGVDRLLSEASTRQYITKPVPQWAAKTDPTPAARAYPLSLYFSDLLECYYQTLHQVAVEQLREITRVGTFMLTNLTAIEHFITDSKQETLATISRKSELMDVMGAIAVHRVQRLIQLSFKEYLTEWSKLAPFLMEATVTSNQGGKLSNKDREAIKEKFRRFNSEFEELLEQQRQAKIADPLLKQAMSQEVKKLLKALYFKFYDKHCSGDFTKNINKYIRWNKEELDRALDFN